MSWTWLTGKMTKESAKQHHARWYEEEVMGENGQEDGAGGEKTSGIGAGLAD